MAPNTPDTQSRQMRTAALVICVTIVVWMGASFLGGQLGLPVKYAFLIDLAALAAFFWALFVVFQVWRAGRKAEE